MEVADNEVSASVAYEECGPCAYNNEGDSECGSAELDTEGEFELWCNGQKLSGDLREASLWPATRYIQLMDRPGGAEFELISNSELTEFNRFKAEKGIHKTSAYLDAKLNDPKTLAVATPKAEEEKKRQVVGPKIAQ